ncbi:PTPLA domain containing protein [Trichuris trichiura]|uniref:Very-long-chain (3R)-3-hydroxyacyl-CoA dehydratase n=1 Tax=Trichuris trichiura TaxID=36087 RepID=A0A077Z832_TRITR|nr:PTPLA domain containing protein [Trichuris trichiura]
MLRVFWSVISGVSVHNIYGIVADRVEFFQTMAILEVIHCSLGVVRAPTLTTLIQVAGRLFVVWPIAHNVVEARTSLGAFLYTIAWSLTEVIRYSFYASGQVNFTPYLLLWLRYSLFLVLYPLGVTGELLAIFAAIEPIKQRKLSSIEMPNSMNISLNFYYVVWCTILLYLPLFPKLYFYMIKQRQKMLIGNAQKKTS